MKKIKNKQQQVKKSKQQKRKTPKYNKKNNSAAPNTVNSNLVETSPFSAKNIRNYIAKQDLEKHEIEQRQINAEMRKKWLSDYGLKLCLLRKQIEDFANENNSIGAIYVEYISEDCQDYLPVAKRPTLESNAEFYMNVRNNVIEDVSLSFSTFPSFQEDLRELQDERREYAVKLKDLEEEFFQDQSYIDETRNHIIWLDSCIASTERTIDLIEKCDYSTHRVISVLDMDIEPVLVSLSSLENSVFDEHDQNWVCGFGADYVCVGNLEQCLDKCHYIDKDVDKPLMKEVCLHTGYARAIHSSIEWNPIRAEKLRKDYKHDVDGDGSLCIAP